MSDDPSISPHLEAALKSLQLRAWSHATTLRLARLINDTEAAWNTASGVLIEIEGRALIATAWHVLEAYVEMKRRGEDVFIVCDNMPLLEPRLVFRHEMYDIAFLEVPRTGRSGIDAIPYRPGTAIWPPPRPQVEDSVLLCGFPKLLRADGVEILHGDLNFLVSVASTAEAHFMLQIELDQLAQAGRAMIPDDTTDFGRVSGGPVFLYDGGGNPLVGLVSQAGETLPLWRVASLACVPPDLGTRESYSLWAA